MLVLRTCNADRTSFGGFRWPEFGPVECTDWIDNDAWGHGLHGLPWGCGDGNRLSWKPDAIWLVIETPWEETRVFGGACKFPCGKVVYSGSQLGAITYLDNHGCGDKPVVGSVRIAGDHATAVTGDRGRATAGLAGTAIAGEWGYAETGSWGCSIAGYGGHSKTGFGGRAIAGYGGDAAAGENGMIAIETWDGDRYGGRPRLVIGYIGEGGLKPDIKYKLDRRNRFISADTIPTESALERFILRKLKPAIHCLRKRRGETAR